MCIGFLMLSFVACKEDAGSIGLDIQPQDEYLNTDYFDSTTVIAHSALHDSLISSNVPINMLGYLDDHDFGKTQAGLYTQFRLSAFSKIFGEQTTVDSMVLTLAYNGYYGDTLSSLLIRVYELDEDMLAGTRYYTKSSLAHGSSSLTENANLYIQPRPKTISDTSVSAAVLRIRLKSDYAKAKFVNAGSSVYESHANFLQHFKGLFVNAEAVNGNGCILSMDMTHSLSGLTIYYSEPEASNRKYTFQMNDSTLHFGSVNHFDYSTADPWLQAQLNNDYTSTNDVLYGQAGAGVKVSFHFPYIREMFKDKKVIIHRAALVINYIDDYSAVYLPPNALTVTTTDVSKLAGFLPDYFLGSNYFGGKYNKTKKEYRFNIAQYIQYLADGSWEDVPLNILLSPNVTHFSRLKMYGVNPTANPDKRLRLEINYTIIE